MVTNTIGYLQYELLSRYHSLIENYKQLRSIIIYTEYTRMTSNTKIIDDII